MSNKITSAPAWDALHVFDAENYAEPFRTIAERIAVSHDFWTTHPIVDEISAALEDAYNLGEKRGPHALQNSAIWSTKMTITAPQMFQEMAPDAPLPWREHKFRRGLIVDAKGEEVCWVDGSDPGWSAIAGMIIVAVNTCGGFKAELEE